ncbi:MAG: hypothetical protein M1387_11680 [Thaumarchaeota archaeon]|nr:hypothetical protein [Nitrososphaerota archaeon]
MTITRKITYSAVAVLLVSLSLTPMLSASASENPDLKRRLNILGLGIATDKATNETHRSNLRLVGEEDTDAEGAKTNGTHRIEAVKGGIVILDNGTKIIYKVVNGTWTGSVSQRGFNAQGKVQDADGNNYDVHLKGATVKHAKGHIMMLVKGQMTDDNNNINSTQNLIYISIVKLGHPITPQPEK